MHRTYIAIDLKSFYASVECVERGLDPLNTNLIVADTTRTKKTICLAVTPALKQFGVPGRPRLFEVNQIVQEVNRARKRNARINALTHKSHFLRDLTQDPTAEVDFLIAPPRMALYMKYSSNIYGIYLRYVAPEDIDVYSVDEVFIDATAYLKLYGVTAREFAMRLIRDVLAQTGITATVGIGPNLFLAKIAMDIDAKHQTPDKDGVRVSELDEMSFRERLWDHRPITDFWRVGPGYARRLASIGLYTMKDIARVSIAGPNEKLNEEALFRLFGVNAELLIDHAWGREPTTIKDIRECIAPTKSVSSGQVLTEPYTAKKARIVVDEMADGLALDLVEKGFVCETVGLVIGFDVESLRNPKIKANYVGPVVDDGYGRAIPKGVNGSVHIGRFSSSSKLIREAILSIFDRIVNPELLIRRINVVANVIRENEIPEERSNAQPDLFGYDEAREREKVLENEKLMHERARQKAILQIQKRFGKNAILRGTSLLEGSTVKKRNSEIGGHKA